MTHLTAGSSDEGYDHEERAMDRQASIDIEVWGMVPVYPNEKVYAFVTGPDDRPSPDTYPNNVISMGRILKEAIDQVAPMRQGHWPQPRHFRIRVEEVDGINTTALTQAEVSGAPPMNNPNFRRHVRVQQELALDDYREGVITARDARRAIRAATDARVLDVLDLVKDQVDAMQLRYMGRYTSYYIDKYDVIRLLTQLTEDIARGNTNVERAIRNGHNTGTPEPAPWIQKGEARPNGAHDGGNPPRRGHKRAN